MFTLALPCVVWMAWTLTRSASTPSSGLKPMAVLLIILLITIGLGLRAGVASRRWNIADSDSSQESGTQDLWLVDTFARSFIVVLLALVGLLALGVTYGNVLGATH